MSHNYDKHTPEEYQKAIDYLHTGLRFSTEQAVIATFLFADMSLEEDLIRGTELQEEWFSDPNHRLIVHAINHLKQTGFYDELTVKDFLSHDNRFNIRVLENCLIANIAGTKHMLDNWINIISKQDMSRLGDI